MSVLKKDYEISIWQDLEITQVVDEESFNFFDEKKYLVIGSSKMSFRGKAKDPILKENLNGTKTLTFSLPFKYFDEDSGSFIENYLVKELNNETKIKLKKEDKWYTFIIKNIEESRSKREVSYSYTCQDLFINELSKIGWEKNFSDEVGNNYGTLKELANRVLEGTTWNYDESESKVGDEFTEDLVVDLSTLNINLTNKVITPLNSGSKTTIAATDKVYLFYTEFLNLFETEKPDEIQILVTDKTYISGEKIKEDGINYFINIGDIPAISKEQNILWNNKADKLVQNPLIHWDKYLERYVNEYKDLNNNVAYGFEKTEFITPILVKNLAVNTKQMVDETGWGYDPNDYNIQIGNVVKNGDVQTIDYYLKFINKTNRPLSPIINEGLISNKYRLTFGQTYIFKIQFDSAAAIKLSLTDKNNVLIKELDNIQSDTYYTIVADGSSRLDYSQCHLAITPKAEETTVRNLEFFEGYEKASGGIIINSKSYYGLEINPSEYAPKITISLFDSYEKDLSTRVPIKSDNYKIVYDKTNTKTRSITEEKSNCYSLIQKLGELFSCWIDYEIVYDSNGKILLDSNFKPTKKIVFKNKVIANNNNAGFVYGVNLDGIKRTLVSDSLTTKLYVEPSDNQYSEDGVCSIELSKYNYSKELFLLNLDYYINKQMLDYGTMINDLYGTSSTNLGYLYKLKIANEGFDKNFVLMKPLVDNKVDLELKLTVIDAGLKAVKTEIERLGKALNIFTADSEKRDEAIANKKRAEDKQTQLTANREIIRAQLYPATVPYSANLSLTDTFYAKYNDRFVLVKYVSYNNDKKEFTVKKISDESIFITNEIYSTTAADKNTLSIKIQDLEDRNEEIIEDKKNLHEIFSEKYYRFIQEGVWTDANYINNDLYYLDARMTLNQSSMPQATYDIGVIDISVLEGYENYNYKIGDLTYIEDTEFFGYYPSSKVPYREPVIVSEIEDNLDKPECTKITIQNYNSQFEELFERITNATQTLEFNKNFYDRAANNFTSNNQISITTLQNSLLNNSLILATSKDQSVIIDDRGIEVSDLFNMSNKIRIVSEGVMLSQDGGRTWETGIKATGINANFIVVGQLDTNKINIMNGNFPSFTWDKKGINAYATEGANDELVNTNKFTRMDSFGFYGVNKSDNSFDSGLSTQNGFADKLNYIKNNSVFSFGWDGFNLKTDNGAVDISSSEDIRVLSVETGFKYDEVDDTWIETKSSTPLEKLKIGRIIKNKKIVKYDSEENPQEFYKDIYGIHLDTYIFDGTDFNKKNILTISEEGRLYLSGLIEVGAGEDNHIFVGNQGEETDNFSFIRINSNKEDNFKVSNKGELYSKNATIYGNIYAEDGKFKGEINATKGSFSGLVSIGKEDKTKIVETEDLETGQTIIKMISQSGISGDTNESPYAFWVGDNFNIDYNGLTTMTKANIEGKISATEGNILGKFKVGNEQDDDKSIILDGYTGRIKSGNGKFVVDSIGNVYAENLTLGNGARIKDYLEFDLNTRIKAKSQTNNTFVEAPNFTLDYSGKLTTNDIEIQNGKMSGTLIVGNDTDGIQIVNDTIPYISSKDSANGWKISNDGSAVFNNVKVKGEISSSIFKYEETQMLSGSMLVAPSTKIKSINVENGYTISPENSIYFNTSVGVTNTFYSMTLNDIVFNESALYCNIKDGTNNNYLFIDKIDKINNKIYVSFISEIIENEGTIITTKTLTDLEITNLINRTITQLGSIKDKSADSQSNLLILINSTKSEMTSNPQAISMFNFEKLIYNSATNTFSTKQTQRLVMGVLPQLDGFDNNLYDKGKFGLYCDNVLIKGALISSNNNITSGINTKNAETNKPIIWGGATRSDGEDGKFKVYNDGRMYATNGYFSGTIESTNATISGGKIIGDGLIIDGQSKGVLFLENISRSGTNSSLVTTQINNEGLKLWSQADLEIYKEDYDGVINPNVPNFKPYIYSSDISETLNSKNLVVLDINNVVDNTRFNNIVIKNKKISFKVSDISSATNQHNTSSILTTDGDKAAIEFGQVSNSLNLSSIDGGSISIGKDIIINENSILKSNKSFIGSELNLGDKIQLQLTDDKQGYNLIIR